MASLDTKNVKLCDSFISQVADKEVSRIIEELRTVFAAQPPDLQIAFALVLAKLEARQDALKPPGGIFKS